MNRNIFVNITTKDLNAAKTFFTALGWQINDQFTDETGACVVVSETIYIMVLTEDKMREFTKKTLADPRSTTEMIIALSAESREEVDAFYDRAIAAGATQAREPEAYEDFMYGRSFEDLDGHIWEVVWMSPEAVQAS